MQYDMDLGNDARSVCPVTIDVFALRALTRLMSSSPALDVKMASKVSSGRV